MFSKCELFHSQPYLGSQAHDSNPPCSLPHTDMSRSYSFRVRHTPPNMPRRRSTDHRHSLRRTVPLLCRVRSRIDILCPLNQHSLCTICTDGRCHIPRQSHCRRSDKHSHLARERKQDPVVQSIVSLTILLRHKFVKQISAKVTNTLLFFVEKM